MMEKFRSLVKSKISQLPETTGVYAFFEETKPLYLYIGKAVNIRERVKQHKDLLALASVKRIGYIKMESEIDALILEAQLIKKHQPKYNTVWRDDKNYFYVAATKESFPQIFITHQPKLSAKNYKLKTEYIGPFVDGKALKETLKILRKVFPYRTCNKIPQHACLWYQLHRCPAPCLVRQEVPGFKEKMKKECQRNVKNLMATLAEGKTPVLKRLKKEMTALSKQRKFEDAAKIRDQITSLGKVFSHSRLVRTEVGPLYESNIWRAEAYDIANIQGKEATGAMAVFTDGEPDKNQYRQFKIKIEQEPNDIAMLKEVLERRLKHQEWPYPDLILTDGGRAQLNIALLATKNYKLKTKIVALAKKNNELYIEGQKKPVLLKTLPRETFNLILRLRDEAHRFARRYHHQLRKKALLG